jgi:hypothetical protein
MSRGRFLVNADQLPFTTAQFDLLSTATQIDPADNKWRLGITWEPTCPEAATTYDPCISVLASDGTVTPVPGPDTDPATKAETWEWQVRGATPFTAYSRIDCSPVGLWEQLSSRNQQALIRSETRAVEETFWTGIADLGVVFPHLAADTVITDGEDLLQPAAATLTSTPQEIVIAIGMLEAAMRDCYPGVATIHMPTRLAAIAAEHDLIAPRAGVMYTTSLGSKVVIGDYPGTAPDGTTPPAGTTWMYATGEVFYAREREPHSFRAVESFDRDVNTLSTIAERTYVIGWDCCLFAIPVLNGEL